MSRKMKDSGIEWIGEIPEDWEVGKVKEVFVRKKAAAMEEDPVVLSLARNGVKVRDISNNEGQLAESYFNYNPVEVGDFLLNPMDLYSGANCNVSNVEGVISPAYVNLRAKNDYSARYFDYYFKTQYWAMALFAHGKGVSFENRWTLNNETLMNYLLPFPKSNEQQKIASFLDKKVAEIDHILEKTRESIEEYKKYKQSIITEAVTKGLNPDVKMKDSGIEWIGEIPEHWGIRKLKFNVSTTKGFAFKQDIFTTEGVPVVKASDIKKNTVLYGDVYIPHNLSKKYETVELFTDDILMTTVGSTPDVQNSAVGQIAKVPSYLNNSLLNQNVVRIRTDSMLNNGYFFYILKTHAFRKYLDLNAHGTANQASLSLADILKYYITFPSIVEQTEIANYLENRCIQVDSILNIKEQLLSDLEAYKKSLIYECVTGKREVV